MSEHALVKIYVTASFTAEPIADSLEFWGHELGHAWQIAFSPYGQVFQTLLSHTEPGPHVVLVRLEDWLSSDSTKDAAKLWQDSRSDFLAALQAFRARSAAPLWLAVCPPSARLMAQPEVLDEHTRQQALLLEGAAAVHDVHILQMSDVLRLYPVQQCLDAHTDLVGHVPYTAEFFGALGSALARQIHTWSSISYKVIVLDCDGTLWQGVCAEEGLSVRIDEGHRHFQQAMLEQMRAGRLLCLCSRNTEEDVMHIFKQHPDMCLRPEHIVAHRVNWESKALNIQALAQELDIGLDRFIFIDDNPLECADVSAQCPSVYVMNFPSKTQDIIRTLPHVWPLDRTALTREDQKRTAFYRENLERQKLLQTAMTLSDFLAGLALQIDIIAATEEHVNRIAQLSERTTQFNINGIRYSAAQVIERLQSPDYACFVTHVRDRFGDYGFVGVTILHFHASHAEVQTLLLSCRALGRGVEHAMLSHAAKCAQARGLSSLALQIIPTARNIPVRRFIESLAIENAATKDNHYAWPVALLCELQYIPTIEATATTAADDKPQTAGSTQGKMRLSVERSTELADVNTLLREIIESKKRRNGQEPLPASPKAPSNGSLEDALTGIWLDILGLSEVSPNDNFFDLGGHSLDAIKIIARVHRELNIKLKIGMFFDCPTIAEQAQVLAQLNSN